MTPSRAPLPGPLTPYEIQSLKGMTVEQLEAREREYRAKGYRVLFLRHVDDQRDPYDETVVCPPIDQDGYPELANAQRLLERLVAMALPSEHGHRIVHGHRLEPAPVAHKTPPNLHYPQGVR